MSKKISLEEIKDNPYFWYFYIKCFRGFDDKNELNLDEALAVIDIDEDELSKWEKNFLANLNDENISFVTGELNAEMSFQIEFRENEIVFFLNEVYIGNLGGHFEAWFLTWDELLAFDKYPSLFLLLLPMTGVELQQTELAKELIKKKLQNIDVFEKNAAYITYCIVNGLVMEQPFVNSEIGLINNQNHSVRNIEKYPDYKEDVKELNVTLRKFVETGR